jgi:hypothetical protein
MADRKVFDELSGDYEKLIQAVNNPSERNYLLAMNEKRRAMFISKYRFDRNMNPENQSLDSILQLAVNHYRLIDGKYLDETVPVTLPYWSDGIRNTKYTRKQLFIYPDYMDGWYARPFHTDLFFNFIDKNKLFEELYKTPEDLGFIHYWIAKASTPEPFTNQITYDNDYPLSDEILKRMITLAETHPQGKSIDLNLIYLMLANRAFVRGDSATGLNYYRHFDKNNFAGSREKYEYLEKTWFMNQMKDLCVNLAWAGKYPEALDLAERFEKDFEKAFAYIFMAEKIYLDRTDPMAFVYLDSVFSKSKSIDFSQLAFGSNTSMDFRYDLILLLSRIGGRQLNALSNRFLAEIIQANKLGGVINRIWGLAETGNFYLAKSAIPTTLTETEDLITRSFIIWQASRKKEIAEGRQKWTALDEFFSHDSYYVLYRPF